MKDWRQNKMLSELPNEGWEILPALDPKKKMFSHTYRINDVPELQDQDFEEAQDTKEFNIARGAIQKATNEKNSSILSLHVNLHSAVK